MVLYFLALVNDKDSVLTTLAADSALTITADAASWQNKMKLGTGMYVMHTCEVRGITIYIACRR